MGRVGSAVAARWWQRESVTLSMFYASEWDAEMVSAVINELKDPAKLKEQLKLIINGPSFVRSLLPSSSPIHTHLPCLVQ